MLLTITYSGRNTTDLGYLLHKNPARPQVFELSHGKAYVFYPEVSDQRTTAALLMDIDPMDLARGRAGAPGGGLFDYVNDRPYVASSFLSTAISKVFGTAMTGRADNHQDLADSPLDLTASLTMLACGSNPNRLIAVFEPLGYQVEYETFSVDEAFPDWGVSRLVNLTISAKVRLRDLLKHLYVLIPVFDNKKHYWVGSAEVEKLLRLGQDWLADHPERAYITDRYLKRQRSLVSIAYDRLTSANATDGEVLEPVAESEDSDKPPPLNARRLDAVMSVLKQCSAKTVIDLGCGEGRLLSRLVQDPQFTRIAGMDVSQVALRRASQRLNLDEASQSKQQRIQLFQGSLTYRDRRFEGYDAACLVEVVEHLEIPRLSALARVLFEFARPRVVVMTTPNHEYNSVYEHLHERDLRHQDHRFEWTRAQFEQWAVGVADKFGYAVEFSGVGDFDEAHGAPTQMGVFTR